MTKLRALNIATSIDGYMAGPDQSIDEPMGRGARPGLHEFMFQSAFGMDMIGAPGERPPRTIDDDYLQAGVDGIGAHIMGRNMFGPVRGEWGDSDWKGWWGDNPPYGHDVYVLTHHAHAPIEMEGGTVFYFVTDGIESALEQATASARGQDIRLGGGASVIRQYLKAGLLDELHIVTSPVILGSGERVFEDLGDWADKYYVESIVGSVTVSHTRILKRQT